MYHPTTRLLTVLELLQARQQMSGRELADRLEVDVRSVRRYVTMLQELGIPVESLRGRYGAYRLRPGFKLPPLMFTDDEALAVMLGLILARRSGLSDSSVAAEGALAKIERVLPVALRARVQAVQARLVVATTPAASVATGAFVMALGEAAQQQRSVWLRYRSWSGETTEREFDPYGVVQRSGWWYTAGYCHLRGDLRVFRLDRLVAIEPRTTTFALPEAFDCLAMVERAIASTPGAWEVLVRLDTTLEEARHQIPATLATLETTDTGILMRGFTADLDWMARILAGLCCPFVILQPTELKDALQRHAAYLLRAQSMHTW